MSEWISVEDKYPGKFDYPVAVAIITFNGVEYVNAFVRKPIFGWWLITHWMKLPKGLS